jgi:hypothetical protein
MEAGAGLREVTNTYCFYIARVRPGQRSVILL